MGRTLAGTACLCSAVCQLEDHGWGLAICFQVGHSRSWQVGLGHQLGASVLIHEGLSGGCVGLLDTWWLGSRLSIPRGRKEKPWVSQNLGLESGTASPLPDSTGQAVHNLNFK